MGYFRNRQQYPLRKWIRSSAVFSLCIVFILALDSIFQDQYRLWLDTAFAFLGLFLSIVGNLYLHIHFDIKDPIKSPVYVKALSFLFTQIICSVFLLASTFSGTITPEESHIINGSPLNFILLASFRASILNFIVLLWLYFIMNDYFKNQLELERSKLDKLKERAINQMLRQQVQPHFLFNALSSLKSLIKRDSQKAESYLLQLSEYLRSSFMTSDDGLATVKQEIKLCEDYLSMQKIRFNDAISYSINVDEELYKDLLPIFSLQPLIDNAIKHNHYTLESPLHIDVLDQNGWIIVRNNVRPRKISQEENNNHGLNNLKERFSYYLKDSVIIKDAGCTFEVQVKIIEK